MSTIGSSVDCGIIKRCPACRKYHLPDTPCKEATHPPGAPCSETHGIHACKRYFPSLSDGSRLWSEEDWAKFIVGK